MNLTTPLIDKYVYSTIETAPKNQINNFNSKKMENHPLTPRLLDTVGGWISQQEAKLSLGYCLTAPFVVT